MVTAATIYMSLLGFDGLRQGAMRSQQNTTTLVDKLLALDGIGPGRLRHIRDVIMSSRW